MSTPNVDGRNPKPNDVMEVELDGDDQTAWPFGALAFVSNPPPPPATAMMAFPAPPSPLWLFEDRAAAADYQRFITCSGVDVTTRQLQLTVEEEGSSEDSCMIKERMTLALRNLKESTDQHLLVQVWAPVKNGNNYVLTTSGQPFVIDPHSNGLLQYRTVSVTYVFSLDGENDKLGLPGRVFRQKVPEWTPNVQYYSSKEYSRLSHALNYNVQGTLALPVFELSGQACVGVVELIMTSRKINYSGEVDRVCKALEAVNLKSSKILDHPTFQICNESRQAVFAEILQTLTMVCEEHKLPLAQTWVPCRYRNVLAQGGGSKKSCSSFDGSCMGQICMSTTDVAFDVIDGHMWGFRDACVEHHLQKGQGVAGRSFASRRPIFCKDITQFCKTEYPLVHYARMFRLCGSFAICLQSNLTGSDDYILEFFLPPECKDFREQQALLKSMISLMVKFFCSLKIVASVDLQEQNCLDDIDMFSLEYEETESKSICIWTCESRFSRNSEHRNHEVVNCIENLERTSPLAEEIALMDTYGEKNDKIVDSNGHGCCSSFVDKNSRPPERKRGKAEKKISLEVLQQYFTGSLKDAAKSLGVCPTTMKRICRQHGISRWPSRKINKVNRSLSKLKRVIESVQETDGAFNLTSFTGPLPTSIAPIAWPVNLDELDLNQSAKPSNLLCQNHQETLAQTSPIAGDEFNDIKGLVLGYNGIQAEAGKASPSSKSRSSSGQGSTNAHTSEEDSCQGSPINQTRIHNQLEEDNGGPLGFRKPSQDPNSLIILTMPLSIFMEHQLHEDGKVNLDSGSSKDVNYLCSPSGIGFYDAHNLGPMTNTANNIAHIQDSWMVTIKAIYRDDIIRFRLPFGASIMTLKNEVAKRLKLDIGTFDIKHLDDDQEWVILTCNLDLEECMELSKRFDKNLIRLLVSDTLCSLGSSCESSGQ